MLRRAAVLACLLAPLAAAAQTTSTLTFSNADTFGRTECLAAAGTSADPILGFNWTIVPSGTPLATWKWQVKALKDGESCTTDNTSARILNKGTMAWNNTNSGTYPGTTGDGTLYLSRVLSVGQASCTTTPSVKVTICVQLWTADTAATTPNASVAKDLVVETSPPNAPTGLAVTAGDQALNVSWNSVPATNTSVAAGSYRVDVKSISTAANCNPLPDPLTDACLGALVASSTSGGTSQRVTGLVNNTTYGVQVYAISAGGNVSVPAAPVAGTPIPVYDYWELYKKMGGQEEGGCGGGPAGVLSLLAVAGLLAVSRRRS